MKRVFRVLSAAVLSAALAQAAEIPKASGVALGATRGRQFDAGFVFINGKFVDPPYTVERWGVGIRINGITVVPQVVDWVDFIKTQAGVKVTKTEVPAASRPEPAPAPPPPPAPAPAPSSGSDDLSLDDLFDDDPKPAKKPAQTAAAPAVRKAPAPPQQRVSYELSGKFKHNDASRVLVQKINAYRTEVDRILRMGGFIFFGDSYSRVTGDARAAMQMLRQLPAIQRRSTSEKELYAAVRAAKLLYLTRPVCDDLFRNRVDYRKLQERRSKVQQDAEFRKMMQNLGVTEL